MYHWPTIKLLATILHCKPTFNQQKLSPFIYICRRVKPLILSINDIWPPLRSVAVSQIYYMNIFREQFLQNMIHLLKASMIQVHVAVFFFYKSVCCLFDWCFISFLMIFSLTQWHPASCSDKINTYLDIYIQVSNKAQNLELVAVETLPI